MRYSYDRRQAMAEPKNYAEWLQQREYKLPPTEAANHRHLLQLVTSVERNLSEVIQRFGGTTSFEHGGKFTKEQLEALVEARKILEGVTVPYALIQVVKDEDDLDF